MVEVMNFAYCESVEQIDDFFCAKNIVACIVLSDCSQPVSLGIVFSLLNIESLSSEDVISVRIKNLQEDIIADIDDIQLPRVFKDNEIENVISIGLSMKNICFSGAGKFYTEILINGDSIFKMPMYVIIKEGE